MTIQIEQRHGWYDLPSGGSVLFEDGLPVRVSDGATLSGDEWDGADERTVVDEVSALVGYPIYLDGWSMAAFEPDATASIEIHVFVDSTDDPGRSAEAWEDLGQQLVQIDIPAALAGIELFEIDEPADKGVLYIGPAKIYELIVAAVAGRCAVYRG